MSLKLTPIKLVPKATKSTEQEQIFMSWELMNQLKIDANQSLQICFGKRFLTVKVCPADLFHNECRLSETILEKIFLPVNTSTYPLQCLYTNQTLYLGPVIALLTDVPISEQMEPSFGTIHHFCGELNSIVSEMGGFFYVFTCSDFSTKGLTGYYFDKGKWVKANLPFPDCIYNRIHSRKVEQSPVFTNFRKELEKLNILFFNDHYLSKWEVYQCLAENTPLLPYLPETQILSKENLAGLMEKYHTVFTKPVYGSNGRNIIKLMKEKNGNQVNLQASHNPVTVIKTRNNSIEEVVACLTPLLRNELYIIQQGISLLEYQTRLMDFRVLVHRKTKKTWKVTSLVARICSEQQFVSNLAKGGTVMKPSAVLTTSFNNQTVLELITLLKELSLEAAATVSQNTSGLMGELGIDIGIDHTGKPWILEINTKPSKSFADSFKVRPSAKAIIQFCILLFFEMVLEKEERK